MRNFKYLKEVSTLKLDRDGCIGCNRCVEVCPHGVFALVEERAKIIEHNACMECGACARNCPVDTVTVDAGVGCASGLITEWLQERNLGRNRQCG